MLKNLFKRNDPSAQQNTNNGDKPKPHPESSGKPGIAQIGNIIAVASGKGGVGKSSVAMNLAAFLKETGLRVGLMDADIYGASQPTMMGASNERSQASQQGGIVPTSCYGIPFVSMGLLMGEDDGPVVLRAPMATKVIHQFLNTVEWGELDYLIVDLPPGTGDIQLTLAQEASLTGAVIVSTPQDVALEIAKKASQMFAKVNVPTIGLVENMSGYECEHCGGSNEIFGKHGAKQLAKDLKIPFLGAVPLTKTIMEGNDKGVPLTQDSRDDAATKAFQDLAGKLQKTVEQLNKSRNISQPREVTIDNQGNLSIQWADGHQGFHHAYNLRLHCVCAGCKDENTGQPILDPATVPLDIQLTNYKQMGRYALSLAFSDGHNTGIYTFERLKSVCECSRCAPQKESVSESFNV